MLPILVFALLLQVPGASAALPGSPPATDASRAAPPHLAAVPIVFEENQGQAPAEFDFLGRVPGGAVLVSQSSLVFAPALELGAPGSAPLARLNLVGASRAARPVAEGAATLRVSRFQGSEPCAWIQRAPTFARVRIPDVWPGIDALVTAEGSSPRYDFELAPGADPALVRLAFDGIEDAWIDDDGALVLAAEWGLWRHAAPRVYQPGSAGPEPIEAAFEIFGAVEGERSVGFRLGHYDRTRTLVIDPTLTFLNLFGAQPFDQANDVVSDGAGGWWVVGTTHSTPFPYAPDTLLGPVGLGDVFLLHFDAANAVSESILIGGSGSDTGVGIAVDVGVLYIAGHSDSVDFPVTAGVFQTTHLGNGDAFVLKLDLGVMGLIYSTYYGGSGFEELHGFAVDASAEPVLVGETASPNLPLIGPLGGLDGTSDAFAVRLESDGSDVVWSGYLGGSNRDVANAVALDAGSTAYIAGELDDLQPDSTAFVQEIAANGALGPQFLYGGSDNDRIDDLIAYGSGDFTLWGTTYSSDLPLVSPLQAQLGGGSDAFLVVHDDFAGVVLATYLGGSEDDFAVAIEEDAASDYLLSLNTESDDLLLIQPMSQWPSARSDAYLAKLGAAQLDWATYLPGGDDEELLSTALDANGQIAVVGSIDNDADDPDQPANYLAGFYTGTGNTNAVFALIDPQLTGGTATMSFGRSYDTAFFDQPYEFQVYRRGANTGAASVDWVVYANTQFFGNLSGTISFAAGEQVGRAVVTFPGGSGGPGTSPTLVLQNPTGAVLGANTRQLTLSTNSSGGGGGNYGGGSSSSDPCFFGGLLPQADARGELEGLRWLRDQVLQRSAPGRALVRWHYRLSRSALPWLLDHPGAALAARCLLLPLVLASAHPGAAAFCLALFVLIRVGAGYRGSIRAQRSPGWPLPACSSVARNMVVLG